MVYYWLCDILRFFFQKTSSMLSFDLGLLTDKKLAKDCGDGVCWGSGNESVDSREDMKVNGWVYGWASVDGPKRGRRWQWPCKFLERILVQRCCDFLRSYSPEMISPILFGPPCPTNQWSSDHTVLRVLNLYGPTCWCLRIGTGDFKIHLCGFRIIWTRTIHINLCDARGQGGVNVHMYGDDSVL